ncbi:LysR family transcriptional regulator [Parasalinivibrio latis]|uniref:LysR family transcriptional regulator n=1 Tax=Parasalinivibrio latis TaxID=2952610 RepID=UPI0030E3880F
MGQLEDMALFVRIVDAGGIGKAAEQLNLAKSAVSRRLNELENRLSTQLLVRTTRKSSLTDAGISFYQMAINILDDVDAMNTQISGAEATLTGTLKVTVPLSFGLLHLNDVFDAFHRLHPQLAMQVDFSDRRADLIEEGFELGIRIAHLKDSSLRARRITTIRHVLCASPSYLEQNGEPRDITQLVDHDYLEYGLLNPGPIKLFDKGGQLHNINLNTKIKANNGDFLKDMAIRGHGVTFLPTFLVYRSILAGQLKPVCTQYRFPEIHAYAVYPQTRFLSLRVRKLIDFVADTFGEEPYWDEMIQSRSCCP